MDSIKALSLTPHGNAWLTESHHPRILHVFDHACNLINERREVLSVVTQKMENGPFNLVVDKDVLFSDHLNLESPISSSPNLLNLGDLIINIDNVKLWSPRPDWEILHSGRDNIAGGLKSCLSSWKSNKFDSFCQREALPCIEQAALAQVKKILPIIPTNRQSPITNLHSPVSHLQFSNSLISAFANADLPSSLTATQKLAGLGNGLTPAGDDFILGAVLAAWTIHPPEIARVLAKEVTDVAAPVTTSLSAAWLRSAGRGEAGILWHRFFEALLTGDPFSIQSAINKLLAVGHTSGADALAGFIGTLCARGLYT